MSDAPSQICLYGLVTDSIVDGPGFRVSIFTQGCSHHCPGCHNPESHDYNGGKQWTLDDVEAKFTGNPLLSGITLSGGEPFDQAAACVELARRAHGKGLDVWTFSGFTYDQLLEKAAANDEIAALLSETDVLVDGPFILSQRSLDLLYCGSKNQRLIDLKQTAAKGDIVLYVPSEW